MKNPQEQSPKPTDVVPFRPLPETTDDLNILVPAFIEKMNTWKYACQQWPFPYSKFGEGVRGSFDVIQTKKGLKPAMDKFDFRPNDVCSILYAFDTFGDAKLDITGGPLLVDPETKNGIVGLNFELRNAYEIEPYPPFTKLLIVRETVATDTNSGGINTQKVVYYQLPGEETFSAERGEMPDTEHPKLLPGCDPMTDAHAKKLFATVDLILLGGNPQTLSKSERRGLPPPKLKQSSE